MLSIINLYAGYGDIEVLKGVNISVNEGEIVALIGPNGAGKSTVIKSVFGIADVKSGSIIFKGKDIKKVQTYELIKIGLSYVPQGKINFGSLNVEENLKIGVLNEDKKIIEKNLKMVYDKFPVLKDKRNEYAFTLSGGEQQMLAIARALMHEPSLLLLDEPSLGLSPILQKEIFEMIKKLNASGIAILVVEQNAKKAIEIANKTYLLEDGKIVLEGGKEILDNKKIKLVYLGGRY